MHRRALNDDEVVVPVRGGGSSAYATLNNDGDEDSDDVTTRRSTLGSVIKSPLMRNVVGFWVLGMCNNFAYVIMLSAAVDIIHGGKGGGGNDTDHCRETITTRNCEEMSTGAILLADILPSLAIKLVAPLFIRRIPFGVRHLLAVLLQGCSFLFVAYGGSFAFEVFGVILASFGSGLGEITYLALASHFENRVISGWASGTGMAGLGGSLSYAMLTDRRMLALTPRQALTTMLAMPALFASAFWVILILPPTVYRVRVWRLSSYLVPETDDDGSPYRPPSRTSRARSPEERPLVADEDDEEVFGSIEPIPSEGITNRRLIPKLLTFMVPLALVYFGEYLINQGLFQIIEFDCDHGLGLSASSQYRWYQALYQLGVFMSRSSSDLFSLPKWMLSVLSVMQCLNALFFYTVARYHFVPHISIIFLLIVYEGLLGGSSYVHTFRIIHRQISPEHKEFSLGFVSSSDSFGIVLAAFASIRLHNYVCSLPY